MALIPATIDVNFTPQYSGLHYIFYKLSTDVSYIPAGSPGTVNGTISVPVSYQFIIYVDNETCDSLIYDVYVQPACFFGTESGKVYQQIEFIPDPACKRYTYTCESVGIDTVDILGYTYHKVEMPKVLLTKRTDNLNQVSIVNMSADELLLNYDEISQ